MKVSDAEAITTAFVAMLYFGGHLDNARWFMKLKGYIPTMLGKSWFCRRLHRLSDLLLTLFFGLGKTLKGHGRSQRLPAGQFSGGGMRQRSYQSFQSFKGRTIQRKAGGDAQVFLWCTGADLVALC